MNTRNGFVYTTFAIFILGLTLTVTMSNTYDVETSGIGEKMRVDEVSYFLRSTTSDLARSTDIISRRALTSLTNHIVNNGEYLDDGEAAFEEAFTNGTVNGSDAGLMNRSTIRYWTDSIQSEARRSQYRLNLSLSNMSVPDTRLLELDLHTRYNMSITDEISRVAFDRTETVTTTISYQGIEDTLLLVESAGRYTTHYAACPADRPATRIGTGTDWFYQADRNWISGDPVTRPANDPVTGVDNKDDKVALVEDLCSYPDTAIQDEFTDFAGVVSASPAVNDTNADSVDVCGNDNVALNAIVDDVANATDTVNRSVTVLTEDQVWENRMQPWTETGCYMDDPWGPTIWGRMEGETRLQPEYDTGIAAFILVSELPTELQDMNRSSIGYVYFDEASDYGDTYQVKGVSNEEFDWFRLDADHVDYWNVSALTYE